MRTTIKLPSFSNVAQITQKLAKANSTADVTFDDMDVIVEPPWMVHGVSRKQLNSTYYGMVK